MAKRGRKKGWRSEAQPTNIAYWMWTLKKPEEVNAFIERGSQQQKDNIKAVLKYLKTFDPYFFQKIEGEKILERLQ